MTRFEECIKRVEDFINLEENWDGFESKVINLQTIENSKVMLNFLKKEDDLLVFPIPDGGIQIEYFNSEENKDYEVEVYEDRVKITSFETTRDDKLYT